MTPQPLTRCLAGHEAEHAAGRGWSTLANGALLDAAETAGFNVLLTGDRTLLHQQNLARRRLGLVVCNPTARHVLRQHIPEIIGSVERAGQGGFITLDLPRPPLVRRPPP